MVFCSRDIYEIKQSKASEQLFLLIFEELHNLHLGSFRLIKKCALYHRSVNRIGISAEWKGTKLFVKPECGFLKAVFFSSVPRKVAQSGSECV